MRVFLPNKPLCFADHLQVRSGVMWCDHHLSITDLSAALLPGHISLRLLFMSWLHPRDRKGQVLPKSVPNKQVYFCILHDDELGDSFKQ